MTQHKLSGNWYGTELVPCSVVMKHWAFSLQSLLFFIFLHTRVNLEASSQIWAHMPLYLYALEAE